MTPEERETWKEHQDRLYAMAVDDGETWDLSENDQAACNAGGDAIMALLDRAALASPLQDALLMSERTWTSKELVEAIQHGIKGGAMVRYPVVLEPDDNGTVMVTFPDFPEAQTFGEDEADALTRASDALATIVDGYIRARRPLPVASRASGHAAELSPLMSTKVELYNAMQRHGTDAVDMPAL